MAELLPGFLGYFLALASGVVAFYFWRKAQAIHQQGSALAKHHAELVSREKAGEHAMREYKNTNQELQRKQQKLEKERDEWRVRCDLSKKEASEREVALQQQLTRAVNQLEHYQAQTTALMAQLQEVDQDKREFRQRLEQRLAEREEAFTNEQRSLESKNFELRKELKKLEEKHNKTSSQLRLAHNTIETIDPNALKKAKFRIHQYHHLYQIMRGHKEMAEERNKNWELALRILAAWILSNHAPSRRIPDSLGALVAEALETIKHGPLIDDGEEDRLGGLGDITQLTEGRPPLTSVQ